MLLKSFNTQDGIVVAFLNQGRIVFKKLSNGEHESPPSGYPSDKKEYAVPEFYLFPIDNEERVRAALSYFGHHSWKPKEHKKEAALRILRAAKKFGITVSKDSEVYRTAH